MDLFGNGFEMCLGMKVAVLEHCKMVQLTPFTAIPCDLPRSNSVAPAEPHCLLRVTGFHSPLDLLTEQLYIIADRERI